MLKSTDREKVIAQRLKSLKIDSGCLTIGEKFEIPECIPTEIPELDSILGEGGGIPRGSVVEFCGDSMSGKSYLATKIAACFHKKNERVALLDAENAFFQPRAEALGVQVTNPELFEKYDKIETAGLYCDLALALVESGDYGVVILDSIQALVADADVDKSLSDNPKIGAGAQVVNRTLKKMLIKCAKTGTIFIFINQFRMGSTGFMGGMAKKAGGGMGVEYFTHIRLWLTPVGSTKGQIIGEKGKVIGGRTKVVTQKLRFGVAKQSCEIPIYFYEDEMDPIADFIKRATDKYNDKINKYVKISRKKHQFIDPNTGEVKEIITTEPAEFIQFLNDEEVEYKENTISALDYIANILKLSEDYMQKVKDSAEYILLHGNDIDEIIEEVTE